MGLSVTWPQGHARSLRDCGAPAAATAPGAVFVPGQLRPLWLMRLGSGLWQEGTCRGPSPRRPGSCAAGVGVSSAHCLARRRLSPRGLRRPLSSSSERLRRAAPRYCGVTAAPGPWRLAAVSDGASTAPGDWVLTEEPPAGPGAPLWAGAAEVAEPWARGSSCCFPERGPEPCSSVCQEKEVVRQKW